MTQFWLFTTILMLIAIGFFVYSMFSKDEQDEENSRDEMNKSFYQSRVEELKKEETDGIIGDQKGMIRDLQRSLLNDVEEVSEVKQRKVNKTILIPGIIVLLGLGYGLYFTIGGYKKVEHWHQVMNDLPQLTQLLASNTNAPLSTQQMQDLMLGLRTRLSQEPDDATGWLLLGRLAISNRNAMEAEGAMLRAYNLEPNNPQVANGYAQTLLMINQKGNEAIARQVLLSVLEQDPTNTDTLSLLAFDAFEQSHFAQAVNYWKMLKSLLPKNDPRLTMLDSSIARAEAQIDPSKTAQNGIVIRIEKAPDVITPKKGMLLIAAYPANSSRMPVAVMRLPITTTFPLTVTLSDSNSMMSSMKLSSLPEAIIKVRLDSDGDVMTKQGDWYGVSKPVAIGGSTFVEIQHQYPVTTSTLHNAMKPSAVIASTTAITTATVDHTTAALANDDADAASNSAILSPKILNPNVQAGAQLFYARCTVCHAAPNPASYTAATWSGIAKSMFPRANLTQKEGQQVLAYLDKNAQKPPTV